MFSQDYRLFQTITMYFQCLMCPGPGPGPWPPAPGPQRAGVCRGHEAVFYEMDQNHIWNLELYSQWTSNTEMKPPPCSLTMWKQNNTSKDLIPTTKFIHSFIQLTPPPTPSLSLPLSLSLSLPAPPSLPLSLSPCPLHSSLMDSCCDLNIINGFCGSAWIKFVSVRFIPALTLLSVLMWLVFSWWMPPPPRQQSFARCPLINSLAEEGGRGENPRHCNSL